MDILILKKYISELHLRDFDSGSQEILNILTDFSNLKTLLLSILNSNTELKRIAENSFYHNLGFVKLGLTDNNTSNCFVKINIWNLKNDLDRNHFYHQFQNYHNHMYNFRSLILNGNLVCNFFEESAQGYTYKKYDSPFLHEKYMFNYIGEVKLKCNLSTSFKKDSSYFLDHETIHFASAPHGEFTSTMGIRSDFRKQSTSIYTTCKLESSLERNKRFSVNELTKTIKLYLKRLTEEAKEKG